MNGTSLVVAALGFGLAYVNGANDVSKGIATLVGSGVSSYRRAILWGAVWTAVGGLLGAVLAKAMVTTFGNDLLGPDTAPNVLAGVATLFGATAWVLIATRTALPVSTTHAIVGSLVGVATIAYGLRRMFLRVESWVWVSNVRRSIEEPCVISPWLGSSPFQLPRCSV